MTARKKPARRRAAPKPKAPHAFVPTPDQRKLVEGMAAVGIKHEDIGRVTINPQTRVGIDDKTLRKHFREELDTGIIKANAAVMQNLFTLATGNGKGAVVAAIFWAKCRMGWKPVEALQLLPPDDVDYAQLTDDELTALEAILAKARRAKPSDT